MGSKDYLSHDLSPLETYILDPFFLLKRLTNAIDILERRLNRVQKLRDLFSYPRRILLVRNHMGIVGTENLRYGNTLRERNSHPFWTLNEDWLHRFYYVLIHHNVRCYPPYRVLIRHNIRFHHPTLPVIM